ncbi:MAG TPA: hypothetical protein VN457_01095 [Chlamydiales bacterium]|nr:hypothetical protein [Chlamydiales bacterium]
MYKKLLILLITAITTTLSAEPSNEPVVTAKKYIEYKYANGHAHESAMPKIVLICYQESAFEHILQMHPEAKRSAAITNLYLIGNGSIGILGKWGVGSPALAIKMEQMIAHGIKKFVAIGIAGTLLPTQKVGDYVFCPKALAEDGVSQHYLAPNTDFAEASKSMIISWNEFAKKEALPAFHTTAAWSFSAIYRESPAHISRVKKLGCGVVEMEAAALFAIGQKQQAETLTHFVVSDTVFEEEWTPHLREPAVRNNLNKLAEWALAFCKQTTTQDVQDL